jgi:hypothetical protein
MQVIFECQKCGRISCIEPMAFFSDTLGRRGYLVYCPKCLSLNIIPIGKGEWVQ